MSTNSSAQAIEAGKQAAAEAAMDFVQDGQLIGLGTGSTVKYFLQALAIRIQKGLHIQGIPTSDTTRRLAEQFKIPLLPDEGEWALDITVDGADQVDPHFNLIKGGGGALLREKIVARSAKKFIVIVDAAKCVPALGMPMPLPIEVIPFGWPNTARYIKREGWNCSLRTQNGATFRTDSGNYILDVTIDSISNPRELGSRLSQIPGVVEHGLFTGLTSLVLVGSPDGVQVIQGACRPD